MPCQGLIFICHPVTEIYYLNIALAMFNTGMSQNHPLRCPILGAHGCPVFVAMGMVYRSYHKCNTLTRMIA